MTFPVAVRKSAEKSDATESRHDGHDGPDAVEIHVRQFLVVTTANTCLSLKMENDMELQKNELMKGAQEAAAV
jgi:hypothetical protein